VIESVFSGPLYSISYDQSVTASELTITLPTQVGVHVSAEVALSAMGPGAYISIANNTVSGTLGAAKARVHSYALMSNTGLVLADAPPDSNRIVLSRCLEVTFRLATMLAEGFAVATVYVLAPTIELQRAVTFIQLVAMVFKLDSGLVGYSHRYMVPAGQALPPRSRITRLAISRAADILGTSRSKLGSVVVDGARVKNAPYRVDPKTKSLRRLRTSGRGAGLLQPSMHSRLARL